jgi:hypothetical protein
MRSAKCPKLIRDLHTTCADTNEPFGREKVVYEFLSGEFGCLIQVHQNKCHEYRSEIQCVDEKTRSY